MFWAAHLVSSAITVGSPCGCSAAYSPFAYLTLPKHLFIFFIFLPVGFVQIDVCRGRLVLLRYALPVGCYIFCLFHPVPALRQKIFVFDLSSQRNKEV